MTLLGGLLAGGFEHADHFGSSGLFVVAPHD